MSSRANNKFGTLKGVFIPSTEAILGTVLFLLLPTLTADAGLYYMLAIIILAHSVSLSTGFSISDVATNLHKIGAGGMYALSKKSLGKAFGGSIGIQLFIAQAASISFYCIGFAEPIQPLAQPFLSDLLSQLSISADAALQKQIIATFCFLIFFVIVMAGADFTLKIQTAIFVVLSVSIAAILASPFLGLEYNGAPLFSGVPNLLGNREMSLPIFFLLFTQFFPAVTGIDAGVGMSGDLQNPQRSLVRGTFSAIAFTFVVYLAVTTVFAYMQADVLIESYDKGNPVGALLTDVLGFGGGFPGNVAGLLVLTGVLFATSSSALSVFMTAPRTLQSLARDKILPRQVNFLANDFRANGSEPRFAALPTFLIALSLIWMGNINFAAMVVGVCFLVVYGWVNGAAFLERFSKNPTFRPTSKGHWGISLYGFLACGAAILLFNPISGIVLTIIQFGIFRLILKYKTRGRLEGVWWGVIFSMLQYGLHTMRGLVQGSKNFRPIVSALAFGGKKHRPERVAYLGKALAEHKGLVNMNILASKEEDVVDVSKSTGLPTSVIVANDFTEAVMSLMQASHPAGIVPNTFLMEYSPHIDSSYIVKRLLAMKLHILILKNGEKFYKHDKIDVWWSSENNGNLMLLLVYMMNSSQKNKKENGGSPSIVRILHRPENQQGGEEAQMQMHRMLAEARLDGVVEIIDEKEASMHRLIKKYSNNCDLVLMGLPGKYIDDEDPLFFRFLLDEYFFERDLEKYKELPPILFVRGAFKINLTED